MRVRLIVDELAPDRARARARRDRRRPDLPRQRAARATSTRVPLWREHYLLVTPAGDAVRRDRHAGREAAELPLCLLTPDMQHRRIVDGAFAAAGATPRAGGGDQLGLHPRRPRPRRPARASPRTPGSTPTRSPTTCARSRWSSPEIEHTIGLVTTTRDRAHAGDRGADRPAGGLRSDAGVAGAIARVGALSA